MFFSFLGTVGKHSKEQYAQARHTKFLKEANEVPMIWDCPVQPSIYLSQNTDAFQSNAQNYTFLEMMTSSLADKRENM
jgi:hypothetical protein